MGSWSMQTSEKTWRSAEPSEPKTAERDGLQATRYSVHLQKNAPSVLAKCQNARPDPKSLIPSGFQATFLDLLSVLSWKLNTPLYP